MDTKTVDRESEPVIELLSERVRNIVGSIPPVILCYGNVVIGGILILIFAILAFLPYREMVPVDVKLDDNTLQTLVRSDVEGIFVMDSIPAYVEVNEVIGLIRTAQKIHLIYSPVAGKLIMNITFGDSIEVGQILFLIVSAKDKVFGISEIAKSDVGKIREGDKVIIEDLAGNKYYGVVDGDVYSRVKENREILFIKIRFDNKLIKIFPGVIYSGKIVLSDISILHKIIRSIGI